MRQVPPWCASGRVVASSSDRRSGASRPPASMSVSRRKLDVTELMTRIEAGGPKIALTLATLGVEVPSRQIQDRSGPKPMPFGKVFFLEVASPWSGVLDLRDAEVIKIVESYRKKK